MARFGQALTASERAVQAIRRTVNPEVPNHVGAE